MVLFKGYKIVQKKLAVFSLSCAVCARPFPAALPLSPSLCTAPWRDFTSSITNRPTTLTKQQIPKTQLLLLSHSSCSVLRFPLCIHPEFSPSQARFCIQRENSSICPLNPVSSHAEARPPPCAGMSGPGRLGAFPDLSHSWLLGFFCNTRQDS